MTWKVAKELKPVGKIRDIFHKVVAYEAAKGPCPGRGKGHHTTLENFVALAIALGIVGSIAGWVHFLSLLVG